MGNKLTSQIIKSVPLYFLPSVYNKILNLETKIKDLLYEIGTAKFHFFLSNIHLTFTKTFLFLQSITKFDKNPNCSIFTKKEKEEKKKVFRRFPN